MGYKVHLFGQAETDYREALEWYKVQSLSTADRFLQELADALEALESHPTYYSYYDKPYRRILLESFPYRIVYKIDGDVVLIYAIYNTNQNEDKLRKRLL